MSIHVDDDERHLRASVHKLVASLSYSNASSFEIFFAFSWVIWGIWFLLRPLDVLHTGMLANGGTIAWGLLLTGIGCARIISIAFRAKTFRKLLAFATTIIWAVITMMMPTHGWMSIAMALHAGLTIFSAWIYLRLNH